MHMLRRLDAILNSITMYRVLLYGLSGLAGFSIVLSAVGVLSYSPLALLVSLIVILLTAQGTSLFIAKVLHRTTNEESSLITGLILFCILLPAQSSTDLIWMALATLIAIGSKHLLTVRNHHVFNPVAIALVVLSVLGSGLGGWWIAAPALFPYILLFAALIVRKVRRTEMVGIFLLCSTLSIALTNRGQIPPLELLREVLLSWPALFFAGIMLTEPRTAPATRPLRAGFAALVGGLFGLQFHVGPIYSSPELALVIGNLFTLLTHPQLSRTLTLTETEQSSPTLLTLAFTPDKPLIYQPGQYMEWTLKEPGLQYPGKTDARGNRRTFTIASAPEEKEVLLGVKVPLHDASEFKQRLRALEPGDTVTVGGVAGDFVLPSNQNEKLGFLAGGIGITPFRSMIAHLLHTKQPRDTHLLYTAPTTDELVYTDLFEQAAQQCNVLTTYLLTRTKELPKKWRCESGRLTVEMLLRVVPDTIERLWYVSGPSAMVEEDVKILKKAGVPAGRIKTDYFPGF